MAVVKESFLSGLGGLYGVPGIKTELVACSETLHPLYYHSCPVVLDSKCILPLISSRVFIKGPIKWSRGL